MEGEDLMRGGGESTIATKYGMLEKIRKNV